MSRPLFVKKLGEQKQVTDGYVKKDGEYKRVRLFYTKKNGQWVHTHEYEQGSLYTEATCQAPAQYFFGCPCGNGDYRNIDDIRDPENHEGNEEVYNETNSTCVTYGTYQTRYSCCKKPISSFTKDLDPDNHEKNKISFTVPSTCTTEGHIEYVWECCGAAAETETLDKDPDNHVGIVVTTEDTKSTCITPGKYKCEFNCCGKVVEEYEKDLYVGNDASYHKGSINGFYESNGGYTHRYFTVCSGCEATIYKTTFHCDMDGGSKVVRKASCTESEQTEYYCSVCGGLGGTFDTADPLGHIMMGPVNDNNAETHYYFCDNDCGLIEREPHTFSDIWVDNYDGIHYRQCSCGYKLVESHNEQAAFSTYGSDVGSAEHYLVCACGAKYFYNYHSPNASGTKCTVCDKPLKTVDGVTYVTSK